MNNLIKDWESYLPENGHDIYVVTHPKSLNKKSVCISNSKENADWVAERLNIAAKLEKLAYDFAIGKTDGSEIKDMA